MASQKSKSNQSQAYLFNFAAIGVGATTVLLAIFGMRGRDIAEPCSGRFGPAVQYSLERGPGELALSSDLQARLAGRDWGVLENASVVATPNGPTAMALRVNLPKVSGELPNGLSFSWMQTPAEPKRAVCLCYHVWVPTDFEFGQGGTLPGVFGGETDAARTVGSGFEPTSFGTHIVWTGSGDLVARVASADHKGSYMPFVASPIELPRGRWVKLEQEIGLNTPGLGDGLMRVWVDGKLRLENERVGWRMNDTSAFRGVDAGIRSRAAGQKPRQSWSRRSNSAGSSVRQVRTLGQIGANLLGRSL
jgi:hypothetical protein